VRFALNFNRKLMILVDFINTTAERKRRYVNYFVVIRLYRASSVHSITQVCTPSVIIHHSVHVFSYMFWL